MKKYTAVVIGLGRIGYTLGFDRKREQPASHTHALWGNRRVEIIAGCDTDVEKCNQWQRRNKGARTFTTTEELFATVKADIVVVAVDESSHLDVTLEAIESQPRIIILEKPVALNMSQAEAIRDTSQRYGVPILVNHERRYSIPYQKARQLIVDEVFGKVQLVRASLWSGMRVYSPKEESTGAYSLLHDGTHLVDIVSYLLGATLEMPTLTAVVRDDAGDTRHVTANYMTGGAGVTLEFSGQSKYFGFDIEIRTATARIVVGNGYFRVEERKESAYYTGFYSLSENKKYHIKGKTGYFSRMVENAIDYLDGKADILSPLECGIDALGSLEQIRQKLK